MTSMAYFRVYWRYIEPERGKFAWEQFDNALKTAHDRGQTLMLRIAPYGIPAPRRTMCPTGTAPWWGTRRTSCP